MIVKRFELDDLIGKVRSAQDVYAAIGYPPESFSDEKVFGKKAYYRNLFMTDQTFQRINSIIVESLHDDGMSKTHARQRAVFDWACFSPMSSGPRYDEFKEQMGHVMHNCLYIAQPGDDLYEECPDV